eukprot:GHVN01063555.1.p1 GENE.GHVN01063555.1~~GHVN01063555.1.p1  ORF type:complete len:234 (-),score=38.95 GHVN01063555.1:351-1052(-)
MEGRQRLMFVKISPERIIEIPKPSSIVDQDHNSGKATLTLENIDSQGRDVAFKIKIKTTTKWTYLVKPSVGVLRSEGHQTVQVTVQGPTEPSIPFPTEDQFLVQALSLQGKGGEAPSKEEWRSISRSVIQEDLRSVKFADPPETQQGITSKQFEDLVVYTESLESRRVHLKKEIAKLKELQSSLGKGGSQSPAHPFRMKFQLWQAALMIVFCVLLNFLIPLCLSVPLNRCLSW